VSAWPSPSALKPGDLIFIMDRDTGNPVSEHLFTVDENEGPVGAEHLARENWDKGWHSITVRCQQQCSADACRPPEFRHFFLLAEGDFTYAKDVTWA
jgi:hypothetical protein